MAESTYRELVTAAVAGAGPLARAVAGALLEPCPGDGFVALIGAGRYVQTGLHRARPLLMMDGSVSPTPFPEETCGRCSGTGRVARDTSSWPPGALAGAVGHAVRPLVYADLHGPRYGDIMEMAEIFSDDYTLAVVKAALEKEAERE